MSIENSIKTNLLENQSCLDNLNKKSGEIKKIIEWLINARNNQKTIFTMGNGGSGSTASHFVSDLLKTAITSDSNRFRAISLVDNMPVSSGHHATKPSSSGHSGCGHHQGTITERL